MKSSDYMAHKSILLGAEEFCDILLNLDGPQFAHAPRNKTVVNPFEQLEDADEMSELDISIAMVS